jgi:hypothetical protein
LSADFESPFFVGTGLLGFQKKSPSPKKLVIQTVLALEKKSVAKKISDPNCFGSCSVWIHKMMKKAIN